MRILTGHDLTTGAVRWWDGAGWSAEVAEAVDVGAASVGADPAAAIIAREEAARRINGAYAIPAAYDAQGRVRPAHIKERIRAAGPSIAMLGADDLALPDVGAPGDHAPGDHHVSL